ncbi:unnamed protein product, partial [Heterobilharzia americana]
MASSDDLKNYLRTALSDDGFLREMKADIMKRIFEKIRNQSPEVKTPPVSDTHSNMKLLINELIIEYLKFESLSFTESVFRTESGHGNTHSLPRRFVCQALQIKPTVNIKSLTSRNHVELDNHKSHNELIEQPIPLLYYIVHYLMVNGLERTCHNETCQENGSTTFRSLNDDKSINDGGNLAKLNTTVPLCDNLASSFTKHRHIHLILNIYPFMKIKVNIIDRTLRILNLTSIKLQI